MMYLKGLFFLSILCINSFAILTASEGLILKKEKVSTNPNRVIVKDPLNDTLKSLPIDSITNRPHGVTPGTVPKAATGSTFTNSPLRTILDTAVFFSGPIGISSDTVKDDFLRVSNPIDSGWLSCSVDFISHFRTYIDINSFGRAEATNDGGLALAVYDSTFLPNQYSWAQVGMAYSNAGVAVRVSTNTCGASGYFFAVRYGATSRLYKRFLGSESLVASGPSISNFSAYIWITATNDTIRCYDSRSSTTVPVITYIDGDVDFGCPAMYAGYGATMWGWRGGSFKYDSILDVNGRMILRNTPTTSTGARVMIKNAEPDDEIRQTLASTLDVDSARIAYYSIVQKTRLSQNSIPVVNLDSSFIDSSWANGGRMNWTSNTFIGSSSPSGPMLYVYGTKAAELSPTIALLNNSSTAGTAGRLFFQNFSSSFGYNRGGFELGLYKRTTATNTGYNDFRLRSYSVTTQYIDHMVIYDSTGQIRFNSAKSDSYRPDWHPVWIEHGGLKVTGKTILDTTPTITIATYFLIDNNDTVSNISPQNVYNSLGLADSITTKKIKVGSATNGTVSDSNGYQAHGLATDWNDIPFAINVGRIPASNYPDQTTFTTNTQAFSFKIGDYIDLQTQEIPHGYANGTNLEPHLHWVTNGTDGTVRYIKFVVYYNVKNTGSVFTEDSVVIDDTIPANTPSMTNMYQDPHSWISGSGLIAGATFKGPRLKRVATGTAPTGNPFVLMFAVHFEQARIGSKNEIPE